MRKHCGCYHTQEVWFVCVSHWRFDFSMWEQEMLGQWGVL